MRNADVITTSEAAEALASHIHKAHGRVTALEKRLEMTDKALGAAHDRITDLSTRVADQNAIEKTERIFRDAVIRMTEEETDAEFLRRCAREADLNGLLPHERDSGMRTGAAERLERIARGKDLERKKFSPPRLPRQMVFYREGSQPASEILDIRFIYEYKEVIAEVSHMKEFGDDGDVRKVKRYRIEISE